MTELQRIAERYARREASDRYSLLRPEVWQMWQERQRALLKLLARRPGQPADWRATEVGCGAGGNLLDLLRLGLMPAHLTGVELLPERLAAARAALPEGVTLLAGDASAAPVAPASQDLVLQSTVFSSILDDALQQRVADAMWRWLKPGGAVVWYDFTVNNPRNPDVRGVPLRRVRALFPQGHFTARRVTLAPPLARALPAAYGLLNAVPWLRTHRLVLIEKP
ncbi:methyltransferase domain-containing protein [Roseateles puraquae]|uniref:SAM-dependent methyltransferase n=1 Tax=Roseateles puraquae TaxID=431059 RepID=A0A254N720_9BURK|nr:methyltransferase domain-containing protein [Roseateles puraquae]MDG0855397.1 methyltransferase domain-containing protein [Roseateles puraquae]OWR03354.1 SAM-dependent methyltransferase [Roseateles puraquae]